MIFADDWILTADLWYRKWVLCQLSHSHCVLTSFLSVFSISVNHCCSFILRVPFNLLCSFSVIVTVLSFFNYIFIKSFSLSHFASIPSLLFISSTPLSLLNMSLSIYSVSVLSFSHFISLICPSQSVLYLFFPFLSFIISLIRLSLSLFFLSTFLSLSLFILSLIYLSFFLSL